MNTANCITISRIILSGFFMFFIFKDGFFSKSLSLMIFSAAAITDYLDGLVARRSNQVTVFGQFLDPIADKILTFSAFLAFVDMDILPAWMVIFVLVREVLITGFRLLAATRSISLPAGRGGKNKTVLQIAIIIFVLCFLVFKETSYWDPSLYSSIITMIRLWMSLVVFVTLWTGISYVKNNWSKVNG